MTLSFAVKRNPPEHSQSVGVLEAPKVGRRGQTQFFIEFFLRELRMNKDDNDLAFEKQEGGEQDVAIIEMDGTLKGKSNHENLKLRYFFLFQKDLIFPADKILLERWDKM